MSSSRSLIAGVHSSNFLHALYLYVCAFVALSQYQKEVSKTSRDEGNTTRSLWLLLALEHVCLARHLGCGAWSRHTLMACSESECLSSL
ncbi:hypothetical protein QYF36_015047 [Acer negundo]|nr:hypothetical protein QYF36_015047 [Acer negundo]